MTLSDYEKRHLSKGEAQSKEDAFNIDTLGIAYTPVEIINFMIRSLDEIYKSEFGTSLGAKDVPIFDPFLGTGRFLEGVIRYKGISDEDLKRKYKNGEMRGQEILPESQKEAKANIEKAYYERFGEHEPFNHIKLGDTFQDHEEWLAKKHPTTEKKTQKKAAKKT